MYSGSTEKELALFIEGKLTNTEARKILQHIAEHPQSAHVLIDVIELQDLEADGLLPETTPQEAARAFHVLEQLMDNSTETSSTFPQSTKNTISKLKPRFDDFVGGVIAIAGATQMQDFLENSMSTPDLAGKNENNSSSFVRNEAIDSSKLAQDDSSVNIDSDKELETMTNNTYALSEAAPTVIGVPGVDGKSHLIQQGYNDTCAIRCQELVLRDFGVNVSEDELRDQATKNGWYAPGSGSYPKDIGKLLELHGVEVNCYEKANIFTLTSELAKGNKIIIGVDSGELWHKGFLEELEDQQGIEQADHALIVSGIDTSDPEHIKVVITDPGSGDVAKEYPIEQFIDAWQDSDFFMVSTVEPAPLVFNPEMINFDYTLGHISKIGNLLYEDFQELSAPCLELQLSDTLLSDQEELLSKYINEGGFLPQHSVSTGDELGFGDDSEPISTIIEDILDFGEEDYSSGHQWNPSEENSNLDGTDDLTNVLFE